MSAWGSILFCFISFMAHPACAMTIPSKSLIGNDLLHQGKKYYSKKDYAHAIHEFSKVLLVEPGNQEALNYLQKMGIKGGTYGHPNRQLSQLAKLSADVEQYKKDIVSLSEENFKTQELNQSLNQELEQRKSSVQKILSAKEIEQEKLRRSLKQTEQRFRDKAGKDQSRIKQYADRSARQGQQIVSLNTNLYSLKQRLNKNISELKAKEERLTDFEQQYNAANVEIKASEREAFDAGINHENKLLAQEQQFEKDKETFAKKNQENQERIQTLRENLRKSMSELSLMKDKLVFTEYKLAHRDHQLTYQDKRLKAFKDSLGELEKELPQLAGNAPGRESNGPGQNASIDSDKEKAKFIHRQDRLIAELKEKLILANLSLEDFQKNNSGPDKQKIAEFEAKIQDLTRQLQEREAALEERNKGYQALESRLNDTQERLGYVENTMQEREREIKALEEQLNNVLFQD